ncbi:MAG: energy transducer TonB [Pyrinomonadaceae bacterium]
MKRFLATFVFCVLFVDSALSQMRVIYPENVKVISSPLPSFPAEAKDLIYGDEVRILMDIDTQGKVKGALVYGPLAPCSNLADPTVVAIKNAALAAVKTMIFEPVRKDGKAIEERVSIGYRLRPVQSPLTDGQRKIVSIGVANGKAKSLPKPEYPEAARAARLSGGISVLVLIDESGRVISAASISGQPEFAVPGVNAACAARFSPMKLQNEPAKMLGAIAYNFAP